MRELKFRAWIVDDLGHGYMSDPFDFDNFEDGGFVNIKGGRKRESPVDIDCLVDIMQYTGLKDKNGKNVYEGDVLRFVSNGKKEKCEVKFVDGCFIVSGIKNLTSWWLCDYDECYEIIGNIYENPELLND